jgi:hypothetical protein
MNAAQYDSEEDDLWEVEEANVKTEWARLFAEWTAENARLKKAAQANGEEFEPLEKPKRPKNPLDRKWPAFGSRRVLRRINPPNGHHNPQVPSTSSPATQPQVSNNECFLALLAVANQQLEQLELGPKKPPPPPACHPFVVLLTAAGWR